MKDETVCPALRTKDFLSTNRADSGGLAEVRDEGGVFRVLRSYAKLGENSLKPGIGASLSKVPRFVEPKQHLFMQNLN